VDRRENLLLIVDDDAWTRYALARLLKYRGWHVLTASCVAEALLDLEPVGVAQPRPSGAEQIAALTRIFHPPLAHALACTK
jgi:CheY-like chemotaxis protein